MGNNFGLAQKLRMLLDYNPETGDLTWRHRIPDSGAFNSKFAGKIAGTIKTEPSGYKKRNIRVTISGNSALTINASKVSWLIHYGEEPSGEIDHVDGNALNNRISNLRCVPRTINMLNKSKYKNNTSGITGVSWHKQHGKWAAQACIDGKNRFLGSFKTKEAAQARVMEARQIAGYTDRHGSESPHVEGGNASSYS
ncbi:endonuclease [Pseudomonas phage PS-1]|uniref:HNH endonuclease n=1 Tax=Pseudomonas phage PS-1 TaxID=1573458 RepID=UPI00065C1ED2|nr:HNH endonuclease [Pseudomonas phage PS-1]BAR92414.1 endonuclease [Pseudomonas phage PS-1]